ncbi:MAG TPA: FecR domain-containing protein [Steroidobacteraceae bacterium]
MDRLRLSLIVVLIVTAVSVYAAVGSSWKSYETAVGGSQVAPLGEGITVRINTNSALRTRISQEHRDVVMMRGEALFDVSHEAGVPFGVEAGRAFVRTRGAKFSVRIRDPQSVDVLVTEGELTVALNDTKGAPGSAVGEGKIVRVRGSGQAVCDTSQDEIARALAWTEGNLRFDRRPLGDIVQEFNRYSERQLIIEDPSLVAARFSGRFVATDEKSFLSTMGILGVVAQDRPEPNGRSVVVLRRAPGVSQQVPPPAG